MSDAAECLASRSDFPRNHIDIWEGYAMLHKCSDPTCPICKGRALMEGAPKEEIKTIDVSDGEPHSIKVDKQTTIMLKGKHVPEQKFTLTPGTYVVNEVLKNIFTTNGRGKYEKVGTQHFLVAERTA